MTVGGPTSASDRPQVLEAVGFEELHFMVKRHLAHFAVEQTAGCSCILQGFARAQNKPHSPQGQQSPTKSRAGLEGEVPESNSLEQTGAEMIALRAEVVLCSAAKKRMPRNQV